MAAYRAFSPRYGLMLACPATWAASVMPALFGILHCFWEGLHLRFSMAVVLLIICVLMQSAANTINDYFDYIRGTDTKDDNLEANDAVLLHYHLNPRLVLLLGCCYLGIAALLGIWVVIQTGPAPLLVGIAGGAIVLLYSSGPMPISNLPLGELFAGVVMGGLIPLGIAAVAWGGLRWIVLLHALPLILGISLIMMTNNTCDIEKDRLARRKTLPVLLGRARALMLYRMAVRIWLLLLIVAPLLLFGIPGIIAPILLLLCTPKTFALLLTSPLTQETRISQMKAILRANYLGNGTFLLALALALCQRICI